MPVQVAPVAPISNPLSRILWTDIFGNYNPPNAGGQASFLGLNYAPPNIDGMDIFGLNKAVDEVNKTLTDNVPSYLVGAFGLILVAAGVYSLAK